MDCKVVSKWYHTLIYLSIRETNTKSVAHFIIMHFLILKTSLGADLSQMIIQKYQNKEKNYKVVSMRPKGFQVVFKIFYATSNFLCPEN